MAKLRLHIATQPQLRVQTSQLFSLTPKLLRMYKECTYTAIQSSDVENHLKVGIYDYQSTHLSSIPLFSLHRNRLDNDTVYWQEPLMTGIPSDSRELFEDSWNPPLALDDRDYCGVHRGEAGVFRRASSRVHSCETPRDTARNCEVGPMLLISCCFRRVLGEPLHWSTGDVTCS